MLPGKTLLNAALVSKKWYDMCQSDYVLRKRIRRQIRIEKRFYLNNLLRNKKDHLKRKYAKQTVFTDITNDKKRMRIDNRNGNFPIFTIYIFIYYIRNK